jgi:CBS domain containing-hemolysin-like protein
MDDPPSTAIGLGLIAIVALVLLNAFFVAAEFALVGARDTRLRQMAEEGDKKAALARKATAHLDRYISATQLGITLASLGLGWIGEPALAGVTEGLFRRLPDAVAPLATHGTAVAIAFAIITTLHIVLGELVPKALAILFPEQVSGWVAAPLMGFAWVLHIPITALNGTANWLLKLVGVPPVGAHDRLHSPEEIRMLVEQSRVGGQLAVDNARLLRSVFEFSEKRAEEVMTPRTKIMALASDQTVDDAVAEVAKTGRSRYPVYAESLDEIVGIVHTKDVLGALKDDSTQPVSALMRPPLLVPATREVEDVLADMKRLKTHMAVVLDEYGGTAGIITMEDVLEEIVGEIFDEHDPDADVTPDTGGTTSVDGTITIAEFNEETGLDLSNTDYTTIGGYVFGRLGRLPKVGDRVVVDGRVVEVATMDGRRVGTVRLAPSTAVGKRPAASAPPPND